MKKLSFILACSLLTSSVTLPVEQKTIVKELEAKYAQFKSAMHDYWSCLKGNKECDPAKIKRVRIAAGILIAAVGTASIIFLAKNQKERALQKANKANAMTLMNNFRGTFPDYSIIRRANTWRIETHYFKYEPSYALRIKNFIRQFDKSSPIYINNAVYTD